MPPKASPQGSLVMLWAGENPAFHWVCSNDSGQRIYLFPTKLWVTIKSR
jgi:hypothetical protein